MSDYKCNYERVEKMDELLAYPEQHVIIINCFMWSYFPVPPGCQKWYDYYLHGAKLPGYKRALWHVQRIQTGFIEALAYNDGKLDPKEI